MKNNIDVLDSPSENTDEMPATERELAEDATWKQIQKNTFTRWCNEHLKCVNKRLANLEIDLSDGLRLISLLEILSQKKMDKYNKRPNFRQMKLENVSVALKFLERERIKLVSIDSKAIVDGNLKLILGLVWTLILHYSISLPMWDEEDEVCEKKNATPKQRLLGWIQNKIPQMPITNFNRDWQDGLALGALVDNCAPGLCPDWEDWNPEDKINNADEAMKLAVEWLGVPSVIAPEEITNPNVDEQSVMTYLSQFPKAQLKPGAPLRPRTNAKKARAYGKGVEPYGLRVGAPAPFNVETIAAGSGDVAVFLTDPTGHEEELVATPNHDKLKSYSVQYHPVLPGEYKVTVLFAGQNIQKSPFAVHVDDTPIDPKQVTAKGPGLQNGNIVGKETYFDVFAAGAGIGNVGADIYGPDGQVKVDITPVEDYVSRVKYTPKSAGQHEININFAGHAIPKSPHHIKVSLPLNPSAVWVEGPGIASEGVPLNQKAVFNVHTENAGEGKLDVKVVGPRGMNQPVHVEPTCDGIYTCNYIPSKPGQYVITVSYGERPVPKSPFRVNIKVPADASKISVQGPGIGPGNVVGKPTYFDVISSDAGDGKLEVSIEDLDGREELVTKERRPDSSTRCKYVPQRKGIHYIQVRFADQMVPNSPFKVDILPDFSENSCVAYGRGIQAHGIRVNESAKFHVATKGAGEAELQVKVTGPRGKQEPVIAKKNRKDPETYDCEYNPLTPGEYTVNVTYGSKHIPKSPFKVSVGKKIGPQKVHAYGPGLHGGKVDSSADFVVETTGNDVGQLGFSIEGPSQARIECDDKGDGSCDVKYYPLEAGEYAVHVMCDDEDIKNSPFMAKIEPADYETFPDKVVAYGPGLEATGPVTGLPTEYTVDARSAGKPGVISNIIKSADGKDVPVEVKDNGDGTYTCRYTPHASVKHTIIPAYDDVAVKQSPFRVLVQENSHPENVRVYGPGLEPGLKAEEPTHFMVDCGKAGSGDISIGLKCTPGLTTSDSESDIPFDIVKNNNDIFTVKYTPPIQGVYTVMVLFADVEIPESPLKVKVASNHNAGRVYVDGPGIEKESVMCGKPTYFTIHTRGAGKAEPSVNFVGGRGNPSPDIHPEIIDNNDSTYTVKYTPNKKGVMKVDVCYGGDDIPKSPFVVNVAPALDIGKVVVTGLEDKIEVGKPQDFQVECGDAGGKGDLDVDVFGPDKAKIPVKKRYGSKYSFTPKEEGTYRVDVNYDGVPVNGSPFLADAYNAADASKVHAYGPGLKEGKVREPANFTIDTKKAGNGGLGVTVEGPCEAKIECVDNGDCTCSVSYLPTESGNYKINVLFADEHIPGSPFNAEIEPVFDASKVSAMLQDLNKGKVGEKSSFIVDCSDAGEAPLDVEFVNEDGSCVPDVRIRDLHNGKYNVSFVPNKPGKGKLHVKYGGEDIPKTPKKVQILPDVDTSSVKAYGPGLEKNGVLADVETDFTVEAKRLAPRGGDHICAKIISPDGAECIAEVKDNKDGNYHVKYTPFEQGQNDVIVEFDDVAVPGSPFHVNVSEGCDASKVKATGPGLVKGETNTPAKFVIDTRGAGTGGLGLAVEGPSDAKITCTDGKDGTCEVEYFPTEPGDYEINITYGGENILGSPFVVPVKNKVDPSKVVCSGPGISQGVRKGVPQKFNIDCKNAGEAPLDVAVKGPRGVNDPVEVADNNDGTYTAFYTPSREGPYKIHVLYAEENVPHCPKHLSVLPKHDASKVKCSGPGVDSVVTASIPIEFLIDAKDAGEGLLAVQITDPEGYPKKAKVTDNADGTYSVAYIPDMRGRYTISVQYGGDEIPYSPYRIRAVPTGNASRCEATGDGLGPTVPVGKEANICVDSSRAGPDGKVTCSMTTPDKGILDLDIVENKDRTFDVFYTPQTLGNHVVNLRYGGEMIPGSPFQVKAIESPSEQNIINEDMIVATDAAPSAHAALNGNDLYPLDQAVDDADELRAVNFMFEIPQDQGELTSVVHMPSGRTATPSIKKNQDSSVSISYQPTETGLHDMDILLDNQHISGVWNERTRETYICKTPTLGSPIQFYIDAIASGFITAHGPGLVTGKVNKPAVFTVVTKDSGAGGLALAVEGPSKAEIKCVDNKDGTCTVSYVPTAPGQYTITVKFDDKHIPGSPFTANICDVVSQRTAKLSYGTTSDIALKINETDLSLLTASIKTPSGQEEDCRLKYLHNGHIGISFTPHETGEHLVSVRKFGKHIINSPFKILVGESEIGNASKVRVYGDGIERAQVFETAEFFVDTRKSGYGGLGLSIEGPSKVDINCHDEKDGVCRVTYSPQEAGDYVINIKFADEHVPGSPFTVKCAGETGMQKESILRQREAQSAATIGSVCDLKLKIPNIATSQSSTSAVHQSYTRSEQTRIGSSTMGGFQESRTMQESRSFGKLIEGGDKNMSSLAPLFTHQSDFGVGVLKDASVHDLSAKVTNPDGITEKAEIVENGESSYSIQFIPKVLGVHTVSVMYCGEHVPGSPFQFTVGPLGQGGAGKVTAGGPGLKKAFVNVPAEFNIWTREAGAGGLSIAVEGPSKAEINFEDRKDGSCGVSYIATEAGEYEVSVKFNDEHIPGSPFPVQVTGGESRPTSSAVKVLHGASDCSKVRSYGNGLRHAIIGDNNTFTVDCSSAGSNMLLVGVHGPQTPCEEVFVKHVGNRRYTVTYSAIESGDYTLIIKWGEEHIPGSPFHVTIT